MENEFNKTEKLYPKVGDLVLIGNTYVRIVGIHLGGSGVQNTVTLRSCPPASHFAMPNEQQDMVVPEYLVLLAGVYRRIA